MGTFTTNLNLYKPTFEETGWDDEVNASTDRVAARISELGLNVKAAPFNAVGDGVADDTTAIQAAIQAAEDTRVSGVYMGATVYFPPGVYLISATLTIEPGVVSENGGSISLVGAGHSATVIKWKTGVTAATSMVRMSKVGAAGMNDGAVWHGITFHGNDIMSRGLWWTDISMMTLDACKFVGFLLGTGNDAQLYMDGAVTGCLLNTIRMNHFYGGLNKGIYGESGRSNTIISNEFGWTDNGSIKLAAGDGNYIVYNDFEGLVTEGRYSIEVDVPRLLIAHNRFEDVTSTKPDSRSIFIDSLQSNITITGNFFGELGAGPDHFIELSGADTEITITNNVYTNLAAVTEILIGNTGGACNNVRVHEEMNGGRVTDSGGVTTQGFTSDYPHGFGRLAINKATAPSAMLDVAGSAFTDGVSTLVKAGAPIDGDFTQIENGMLAVDSTNNRLYVRIGGTWKYVALT